MKIEKFDSINVVPFIDIMLVLLVIVLTTATFIATGMIPVNLSEGKSSVKINKQKTIILTIKQDGNLYFNKQEIALSQIEPRLSSYKKSVAININCDKNSKFDNFVKVIDLLKQKGYTNLGIITKHE